MNKNSSVNRGTGLLIIEVRNSNPNGDPDAESEPRTVDSDGRGIISPVSYKRKLRDLISDSEGALLQEATKQLGLLQDKKYEILETRGRNRQAIGKMDEESFLNTYWDARVFGNTFLESLTAEEKKKGGKDHFISTGTVQFGVGVSVAPVEIERLTTTNKAGVEENKDRGMAPLGFRVVRHAVYVMPFFVNGTRAARTQCGPDDIELLKFAIPHAYRNTASAIRPFVEIRHAWYAEHKSPLGSCPDSLILDSLQPKKTKGDPSEASISIDDYEIPVNLTEDILARLHSFEDLNLKES